MFGIGGGELFFIILVVLMLFGSDKVPEIARNLGRGMQQLKNATNEIKSEIHKSADVDGIKKSFTEIGTTDTAGEITREIEQVKQDIEDMSGPIKRQN
ncbi:twin-arginine translocase TatA/TatE family subunit [Flavobacterium cyanobacteriorum]|uniref:Twin-arginine translocase TatA/TatE family subunit n=1 Tax=Flavobacterium cyanobacteriorum TaxID=2022802 RepID=A0A255ZNU8_9FLAO|nr:twin-arginine translocase TatA/TatE family subunit [Flavobacterium cyanobacteriorum]OYQ43168.1 twin-arginine translocase TatA/TatE family subunit [Flavobacterium cyanobacteriorum]